MIIVLMMIYFECWMLNVVMCLYYIKLIDLEEENLQTSM